ncbi:MAG: tetrahydrofolate dehydrogenase/cyclohydrolase catalytic domain-containing protein, partial [Candidatus Thiodiazotropha sp.]
MTARIIDGKALAKTLRVKFRERVNDLVAKGLRPGLAVILVGENPASKVYVGNKV